VAVAQNDFASATNKTNIRHCTALFWSFFAWPDTKKSINLRVSCAFKRTIALSTDKKYKIRNDARTYIRTLATWGVFSLPHQEVIMEMSFVFNALATALSFGLVAAVVLGVV
jgi:hypothetical protein